MENASRISVMSIIVEDINASSQINDVLHEYAKYIVGRMGIPYKEKNVSVICVVFDAPGDITNAASGKLGRISGVNIKTTTQKQS